MLIAAATHMQQCMGLWQTCTMQCQLGNLIYATGLWSSGAAHMLVYVSVLRVPGMQQHNACEVQALHFTLA